MLISENMNTKDRVYDFILRYTTEHLYPPSFQEICTGTDLGSKASVFEYIHKLADDGKIVLGDSGQSRCIKLAGYRLTKAGDDISN